MTCVTRSVVVLAPRKQKSETGVTHATGGARRWRETCKTNHRDEEDNKTNNFWNKFKKCSLRSSHRTTVVVPV